MVIGVAAAHELAAGIAGRVTLANQEKPVLLAIADISGYTRFVAANQTSLVHGQVIISALMRSILKELSLPLRVSKLEGDAVFFYLESDGQDRLLRGMSGGLHERIDRMFAAFHRRIAELIQSNQCPCAGCQSIRTLRLKIVLHHGRALFYKLDRFMELAGLDVILVHRLLKNSVMGDEYVLVTEAARAALFLPESIHFETGEERYDDAGSIVTYVYRPTYPAPNSLPDYSGPYYRWKTDQLKVWSERLIRWGRLRMPFFHHLRPTNDAAEPPEVVVSEQP